MKTQRLAVTIALLLGALGCRDDAESPTAPAGTRPEPNLAAASTLAFGQVSAGDFHSCGVTQDNRIYCWGTNNAGQLGNGTSTGPETCPPFDIPCSTRPVAVAGGHRFRHVSAGARYTCGVTTDNVAYCWGEGGNGALGTGSRSNSPVPVAVATKLKFRHVEAGAGQTCGLTDPDGQAYCWGANNYGQLGNGSNTGSDLCSVSFPCSTRPVPVAGRRAFRQVTAGRLHTCAVTPTYEAYCWGHNRYGQLGDSTSASLRLRPSVVAGGHRFVQIDASGNHTCAVTAGDRAFCWGSGENGEIGDGKTYVRFWPRRVAGRLSFDRVSAGFAHTCGESTSNVAYCWGANNDGQLGDGTTVYRLSPVAVAGGLSFAQVSASQDGVHTCGKTAAGLAYCWGHNTLGQLGDGTTTNRLTPTPVLGPRDR